jgi:hypothetical protein
VFSLPVTYQDADGDARRSALPVLAVRSRDGTVMLPHAAMAWSRHLIRQKRSPASVARDLAALGRLAAYVAVVHGDAPLDPEMLALLIYAAIAYRAGDRRTEDADVRSTLNWDAVTTAVAWAEYKALVRFFSFAGGADIQVDLTGGVAPTGRFFEAAVTYHAQGARDFFVHLAPQRERWRRMCSAVDPEVELQGPPIRPTFIRPTSVVTTMSIEEVEAIIRAERNPSLRVLWILLAFGGMRVSEALNLWQVDVMPGSASRAFADFDQTGLPFVLLADPARSPFIGDIRTRGTTRAKYLHERWGRLPRPALPHRHPERAGWKSMLLTSAEWEASWVYWTDNRWASRFAEGIVEIRAFHRRHEVSKRHPYFFVNTSREDTLGGVLKYSHVAKGFERTCRRAGYEPHKFRRNIHGLRHFYKWTTDKVLGLTPDLIQVMMHHRSISSQVDYGRKATDVAKALEAALSGRG